MFNYKMLQNDFQKLIKRDGLSHAYLFFGGDRSDDEDKVIFAKSLANFLENGAFGEPKKLLTEALIIEKDEEGKIGIDAARNIKHFLYQKPVASKYRTLIVVGADALTPEAKNSILKIVEEPPEPALIVFTVGQEDNLSPALKSRFQKIYFPLATRERNSISVNQRIINQRQSAFGINDAIDENIDNFFEDLIAKLRKDPMRNAKSLAAALRYLTLIKQFNTNKRLQLKALQTILDN